MRRKVLWIKRPKIRPEPHRLIRIQGDDYQGTFDKIAEFIPIEGSKCTRLYIQLRDGDFLASPDHWPKTKRWQYVNEEAAAMHLSAPVPVPSEAAEV